MANSKPAETKTKPSAETGREEALKKQVAALQKERDSALARLKAQSKHVDDLERENGQMRSMLEKLRDEAPPELTDGAYQLTESVLFQNANTGEGVNGKPGDVVVLVPEDGTAGATKRDCDMIAKQLGPGYRAYPVTKNTLDELQLKDMLRG